MEARNLYPVLVAATIFGSLWCAFLYALLPMGPVGGLYATLKPDLLESAGDTEGRRLMGRVRDEIIDAVRLGVLAAGVPLLAANLGWGYLAYRLLREWGDID